VGTVWLCSGVVAERGVCVYNEAGKATGWLLSGVGVERC
jgi:hypothetical protein